MSFMLTPDQILAQTKKVTRRIGWRNLLVGTAIQPVRKGMGLKAGEKVERLGGPIRITDVRREPLNVMLHPSEYGVRECALEGFPNYTPSEFVRMFCESHDCDFDSMVTRIEFEYLPPSI
jgi:hypothetical protein